MKEGKEEQKKKLCKKSENLAKKWQKCGGFDLLNGCNGDRIGSTLISLVYF